MSRLSAEVRDKGKPQKERDKEGGGVKVDNVDSRTCDSSLSERLNVRQQPYNNNNNIQRFNAVAVRGTFAFTPTEDDP